MTFLRNHLQRTVSHRDKHLKTKGLDVVEYVSVILAGLMLVGFTATTFLDVTSRLLGRQLPWLQEMTLLFLVWSLFIGAAAAQRRTEHFVLTAPGPDASPTRRKVSETISAIALVALGAIAVIYGLDNLSSSWSNRLPVTGWPLSILLAAIPTFGLMVIVFTIERVLLGWRSGFPPPANESFGNTEVDNEEVFPNGK